ncbi:MAG TPA: hypothetical protein PLB01_08015 [Thermoanaerobaculia bacterium]|nr:hypothetical protein [Thermoanaerobaculia bacterium]
MRRKPRALLFLVAALLIASSPARPEEISASEIRVSAGTTRSGDLVALGRRILLEGELEGSVVLVGGGEAVVTGRIRRDLVLLGANATIRRGARIDGDVLSLGGSLTFEENPPVSSDVSPFRGPSHPQVGGRVRTVSALEAAVATELQTSPAASLAQWPFLLSFRLALLFAWLVVSLLLLVLAPRAIGESAAGVAGRSAFLGALGATAVLTAALAGALALSLLPSRVSLAAGAVVLLALVAAKVWGLTALFLALGRRLNASARRGSALFGDPAAAALGLLALGAASLVPVVGPLVWGAASLVGIGVSLADAASRAPRVALAPS